MWIVFTINHTNSLHLTLAAFWRHVVAPYGSVVWICFDWQVLQSWCYSGSATFLNACIDPLKSPVLTAEGEMKHICRFHQLTHKWLLYFDIQNFRWIKIKMSSLIDKLFPHFTFYDKGIDLLVTCTCISFCVQGLRVNLKLQRPP